MALLPNSITSLLLSPPAVGLKYDLMPHCEVLSPRLGESFSSIAAVTMQSAIPQQPGCSRNRILYKSSDKGKGAGGEEEEEES